MRGMRRWALGPNRRTHFPTPLPSAPGSRTSAPAPRSWNAPTHTHLDVTVAHRAVGGRARLARVAHQAKAGVAAGALADVFGAVAAA